MFDDQVVHVIEDDLGMRDALLLLLASARLPARGYASAEDFLAKEERGRSACLLVDVRLPGMDGLALQRHLLLRGNDPAIVMITGHGDIALAVAALKAGAVDFVTKPFNPADLLDSVRGAWKRSEDTRRGQPGLPPARFQTLTPRETSILRASVGGATEQDHCR